MTDDWLDSWMGRRERPTPSTFDAAKRWATRHQRADNGFNDGPNILPLADTMYILRHGKKAWRKLRLPQ